MKTVGLYSVLTLFTCIFYSCDSGVGVYVRNFENDTIGISVKYLYPNDRLDWQGDSLRFSNEIVEIKIQSYKKLPYKLSVNRIDSLRYSIELPAKSTTYLEHVFFNCCVEWVILKAKTWSDTIYLCGENIDYNRYNRLEDLKRKGVFKENYLYSYPVLNIIKDSIK